MQIEKELQPLPTVVFVLELPVVLSGNDISVMLYSRQGIIVACGECCDNFKIGDKIRLPLFHQYETIVKIEEGEELIKIDCKHIYHLA